MNLGITTLRRRASGMTGTALASHNQAADCLTAVQRHAQDMAAEEIKIVRLHRAAKGAMVALRQMLADSEIDLEKRPGLPDLVDELSAAIRDCET